MLISPRKGSKRSGIGIVSSLVVIVGAACAFLILLQDYTQATMARPAPQLDAAAVSLSQPIFVSDAERACFEKAPAAAASDMKRVITTQLVYARTGDSDTAVKLINVPPQGVCPLHVKAIVRTLGRIAGAKMMTIQRATISHDRNEGVVYCRVTFADQPPAIALYSMALNETGSWRIQNIQIKRHHCESSPSYGLLTSLSASQLSSTESERYRWATLHGSAAPTASAAGQIN